MKTIITKEKVCCSCKQSLPLDFFNKNRSETDGLQKACKKCKKKHSKTYRERHPEQKQRPENKKKIYLDRRIFVLSYLLEHPCVDCGETDPVLLDFDHVRGTKIANISRMVSWNSSTEAIKKEIVKCEVRCANCHRKKTAKEQLWYRDIDLDLLRQAA
jgi:hypothetical protein